MTQGRSLHFSPNLENHTPTNPKYASINMRRVCRVLSLIIRLEEFVFPMTFFALRLRPARCCVRTAWVWASTYRYIEEHFPGYDIAEYSLWDISAWPFRRIYDNPFFLSNSIEMNHLPYIHLEYYVSSYPADTYLWIKFLKGRAPIFQSEYSAWLVQCRLQCDLRIPECQAGLCFHDSEDQQDENISRR